LNPAYSADEFNFYLSDLNAQALILMAGLTPLAGCVAQTLDIPVIELAQVPDREAGTFKLRGSDRPLYGTGGFAYEDDVALVLHTSGTTSRPKMVPLSQRNICSSAFNMVSSLELTGSDRCLNVMPLFHIHGLGTTLASFAAGSGVICTPGFYAPEFYSWIEEFQPTWYSAVPTMHQAILSRAEENSEIIRDNPLRFIRSASSALPRQTLTELETTFKAPVIEAYGMTEASHQMACNPLPPRKRRVGSVGVATGIEVAIMDQEGSLLPSGETGEIVIRGPSVMSGYENNPTANESAFIDGWFRTGDQGFLDSDAYLFITGRLKEIINRGGEKISPREVDEVLLEHPAVSQAVTFAVPDAELGEEVCAAVVLRENFTLSESELQIHAAERLAYFKVPRQIVFLEAIPKGATGKLQRIGLAEKLGISAITQQPEQAPYVPPSTRIEVAVAEMWVEVLKVRRVGIHDNFFYLGGDSILAFRLISKMRDQMGIDLSLTKFFRGPTVASIAAEIEDQRGELTGLSVEG
jgi:acyl-CoA synthetase (AMP-forming)/AMP-acid ligase II/acyl carrier protein